MREQDKYSLWTLCKTLQYRKVFTNAVVVEARIPPVLAEGSVKFLHRRRDVTMDMVSWQVLSELMRWNLQRQLL